MESEKEKEDKLFKENMAKIQEEIDYNFLHLFSFKTPIFNIKN